MIPNLGSRSANVRALAETRVLDLERAVARIDSRSRSGALGCTMRRVVKGGHGFTVGQWVKYSGSTWSTAATSSTFTADIVGVVVRVVDTNTVDVVTAGYVQIIGQSFTAWARYYLSTSAGTATTTAPAAPNVVQPLGIGHEDGWFEVGGMALVTQRSRRLSELLDVDPTTVGTPNDADLLSYNAASSLWKATAVAGLLGTRAALSVIGRSANSAGAAADITATTTGQVLQMGASSLVWATLSTASYGAATVTAAKLGADVVLDTLNDVTITSVAAGDFVRYDVGSSQWVNTNLGEIAWASSSRTLVLDGGASASAASKIGIGKAGSRLIVGTGTAIEWILSPDPDLNTETAARIRSTSAADVTFYDQATSTFASGTDVMVWGTDASAANRFFRFRIPLQVADTGTKNLIVSSAATQTWTIKDDVGPSTFATFLGAGADAYLRRIKIGCDLDFGGGDWVIYADRSGGTLSSRLWVGVSDGVWSQDANITVTAPTLLRLTGGNTAATYGRLDASTSGVSLFCSSSGTQTGFVGCTSSGIALTTSGSNPVAITAASVTMTGDLTVATTRLTVTSTAVTAGVPFIVNASTPSATLKQSGTTVGVWDASKLVVGGSASGATTAALTSSSLSLGGNQIVGTRLGAVADVTAGGTTDTNCRTTVNAILARMRSHGLIDP